MWSELLRRSLKGSLPETLIYDLMGSKWGIWGQVLERPASENSGPGPSSIKGLAFACARRTGGVGSPVLRDLI